MKLLLPLCLVLSLSGLLLAGLLLPGCNGDSVFIFPFITPTPIIFPIVTPTPTPSPTGWGIPAGTYTGTVDATRILMNLTTNDHTDTPTQYALSYTFNANNNLQVGSVEAVVGAIGGSQSGTTQIQYTVTAINKALGTYSITYDRTDVSPEYTLTGTQTETFTDQGNSSVAYSLTADVANAQYRKQETRSGTLTK